MSGDNQEIRLLQGRLNGAQKNRTRKLLDMLYTPKELADEIGINVRQVYKVYIPAGCPHKRDEHRHIWINGKAFQEWVEKTYKKIELGKQQAYCRTCDMAVDIVSPTQNQTVDSDYLLSLCPKCGRKVARFIRNRRGQVDKPG